MIGRIWKRLSSLFRKDALERELDEEMRYHLERDIEQNLRSGMSPDEARRAALRAFGGMEQSKEACREARGGRLIDESWQDLRYGLRLMHKAPGFTAVVVATFALGIAINASVFSVVNGVLLKPLPYPNPDELVTIHQSKPNFDTGAIPYPNFLDMKKENRTFAAMALTRSYGFTLTGAGEPERVSAQLVSADFFSLLGVEPVMGRTFSQSEDEKGAAPVALVSADFWQRKLGSAPDVLGKGINLDERSYTIVGVIPADFNLRVNIFRQSDVYVPIGQWDNPVLQNRAAALSLHGVGRLKPGVTLEQAQADLDRVMRGLAQAYPATNKDNGAKIIPLKERMVGYVRPTLWMLLGAVGFVLLIACVNVSNLLLARSTSRAREFAVRAALGASRWRLLRQSLTESILLALMGCGLGLLLAEWGTRAALNLLPTTLPRAEEVGLDARVLLFTILISLLTGVVAGLAPALKISQRRLSETLKEGGRGASHGRSRAQGFLVVVEMALALILLIGAGLMIRSVSALWDVDPGFNQENVLTFNLNLPPAMQTASPEAVRAALRDLSDELNSTPGVEAASFSIGTFPILNEDDLFFWLADQPKPASQSQMHMSLVSLVEPGYLKAMGIALKRGRFFEKQDDERSQAVAVIDETFARKYFPNQEPIGKRIQLDDEQPPLEVIGVVGHVKSWGIDADESQTLQAQLYLPFRALPDRQMRGAATVVRVAARTDKLRPASFESIRSAVRSRNSQNVIFRPLTMNEVIAASLASHRFSMTLLNIFAGVALLLASVGLYGVISYIVGQRTQEFGIRLALGARPRDLFRLVMSQGLKMVLCGVALGLVVALCLTRLMEKMLYGVSATDPATFMLITLLLTAVALVASLVPAYRAAKVDPLLALRSE
ncbi:MAG TPA: ABC transporter permease [Pyrinomonadaceae bacterium]|nr:ABC transporter permease [Pyrinomonadaceae bacterium]